MFTDGDSLMYKIKTEDICEDFSSSKGMFYFSNYSAQSKYCDSSNKLAIEKMKDEGGGKAIEEFVWSKPEIYSLLVDDNSKHKKQKT